MWSLATNNQQEGARTFDKDLRTIASPVDGTVACIGAVDTSSSDVPTLEQIKVRLLLAIPAFPSLFDLMSVK